MASRSDDIRKFLKSIRDIIFPPPPQSPPQSPSPSPSDPTLKKVEELASKYCILFHAVANIKEKLEKLNIAKEHIAPERFEALTKDYTSFLNRSEPSLAVAAEEIDSNLEIKRKEADAISEELSETRKTIKQENKLHEVGAISNEEYMEKINPLKSNEEKLQKKDKDKQAQIKILEDAKNNKIGPDSWPIGPDPGPIGPDPGSIGPDPPPKFYKNPSIAAVFSFFYMGLGQIYNEQIAKGVIFIIVYLISIALMFVGIGFITTPILWIWGMVDANLSAKKINKAIAVS